MKKILSILLVLFMLLTASAALAENMGVQVIGGPEVETEMVSLDDVIIATDVEIPGYGIITPTAFQFKNILTQYQAGKGNESPYYSGSDFTSGEEAEFAVFSMDILNTTTKMHQYIGDCSVIVVYDDTYEYGGWCYQRNYDNNTYGEIGYGGVQEDCGKQNINWVVDPADNFEIEPMYQGHYTFGCTLPNAVVEGDKPLKMIITIDGNEITYNIRK